MTIRWHYSVGWMIKQKTEIVQSFISIGFPPGSIETNQGQTSSSHDLNFMRAILSGDWDSTNGKLRMGSQIFLWQWANRIWDSCHSTSPRIFHSSSRLEHRPAGPWARPLGVEIWH